jgi:hypothetical protein
VEAQNKDLNINVIRSAWRRMKKGHIKVRDLQPQKDVKGGGDVTGNSNPSQAAQAARAPQAATNRVKVNRTVV